MFDGEIASEKGNIKLLDGIAKLAAECLKMEDKIRPEMVEVADRLRTIRKVLQKRKGRSSIDDRMEITTNFSNDPLMVPTISLAELKQITRNFRNDTLIGGGLYGNVFFGVLKDGQKSAIMKLDPNSIEETFLEFPVVSRFKHENVVQLLGYCSDRDNCVLAYEYAPGGTGLMSLNFSKKLKTTGNKGVRGAQPGPVLSWGQRVKIALSAANWLEFLHQKARPCVIHGAIKSSNVLLFDDDVAKIGDIGVSRQAPYSEDDILLDRISPIPHCGPCGAPEEWFMQGKTTKSDVYNFGVVLLELVTGRKAYDPKLRPALLVAWAKPKLSESKLHRCVDLRLGGGYPLKALAKMAEIAALCVQYEMDFRPNMSEVVEALRPLLLSSSSNLPSAAETS